MLGVSGLMGSSGDGAAAGDAHESGGASGGSSEVDASSSIPGGGGGGLEESERSGGGGSGGGNRWPRQETLALLKIRSDMDVTFRDSSLKGPLWEEVSRKMAELGFQRSAKKCKEKFENVFKYHKRTKDVRSSKSDGKTYRFFDQLEAFESAPPPHFNSPAPPRTSTPTAAPPPPINTAAPMPPANATVSSISPTPISEVRPNVNPLINSSSYNQPSQDHHHPHQAQFPSLNTAASNPHALPTGFVYSTSSSTSSDEDIQRRRGKKRKWKDFFERLMKDVVQKQEELQKKFLDTLERRERDRMAREDAWRAQEIGRLNREHELLVQERSIAAAKDAAVMAFLQKVSDQHNLQIPNLGNITASAPPPPPSTTVQAPMQVHLTPPNPLTPPPQPSSNISPTVPPPPPPRPILAPPLAAAAPVKTADNPKADNGGGGSGDNNAISGGGSSSRWPKAEVQTLINLRTNLDIKYQENGPKGPLWEEISSSMAKMGYTRSAKRCKEKWENINKYFKKVKESNKKRPEDSKTCPYFHQLDAIYRERAKSDAVSFRPEIGNPTAEPIMARPEQQWPLAPLQDPAMPADRHHRDNESDNNDHDEDGDDDEDEEDEGGGYEMVPNKPSSDAAE